MLKYLTSIGRVGNTAKQKKPSQSLKESERLLAEAQMLAKVGHWRMTPDLSQVHWSDEAYRILGFEPQSFEPQLEDFFAMVHPNDLGELKQRLEILQSSGDAESDYRIIVDGEIRYVRSQGRWTMDGDKAVGLFGTIQDITEARLAQEAHRANERSLANAQRLAHIGSFERDLPTGKYLWSDEMYRIYGHDRDTFVPSFETVTPHVHPDDLERLVLSAQEAVAAGKSYTIEYRLIRRDGTIAHVLARGEVSETNAAGEAIKLSGTLQDMTGQRQMEEKLRQAQKMEAVGQLTGGIAHDFNNLLMVIIGNLDILESRLEKRDPLQSFTSAAKKGALRGAELTHRLLAFSRKQTLRPEVVDAGELLENMETLLSRTLGEMVRVKIRLSGEPVTIEVDPGQLESAILNLAINARDAMPLGGSLTIGASKSLVSNDLASQHEVEPGSYVIIGVSDVGEGMPKEVVDEAFQPFFTTKDVGKGSGLGLSMVYGFAKQSGGFVTICSEVGEGTDVGIYLPRASDTAIPLVQSESTPNASGVVEPICGHVLLVEDDEDVRRSVASMLQSLGLDVLEAEDGPAALELMDRHDRIDLLLTDVMLPNGMDGGAIGEEFEKRFPESGIIYSSGYSEEDMTSRGRLWERADFLPKPYKISDLIEIVSRKLGG